MSRGRNPSDLSELQYHHTPLNLRTLGVNITRGYRDIWIIRIIFFIVTAGGSQNDFFLKSWLSSWTDKKFERFEGFSIWGESTWHSHNTLLANIKGNGEKKSHGKVIGQVLWEIFLFYLFNKFWDSNHQTNL